MIPKVEFHRLHIVTTHNLSCLLPHIFAPRLGLKERMREEVISSAGTNNVADRTPAASSAVASSPSVPANVGSADWSGHGPGSKTGSLTCIGTQPICTSLSTSAGGSALGTSKPSCRPWERGDLLRRLATFKLSNWFGKPKAACSLSCARQGWVNVDIDKIECETCGANLKYMSAPWMSAEADAIAEDFSKQLDLGHKGTCPWKGNSCPESLVQFPPTPPSALIGGYRDRSDGLLQFLALPVVDSTAIDQMRISQGPKFDRFLAHSLNFLVGESGIKFENVAGIEFYKEETSSIYSRAQKLISLCGWEPRWLPDVQDFEDHSAQSARNGCSVDPSKDFSWRRDHDPSKKAFSTTAKNDSGKNDTMGPESKCESRSPLLDCSLCGATVRIWDFSTVFRPARVALNGVDIPEASKKAAITRGNSAASGISGWVGPDGIEKENTDYLDEAATTDQRKLTSSAGVDLNLTMAGGLGEDLTIRHQSNNEAGDRTTSFNSQGPINHKRILDEDTNTVDRLFRVQPADSVEGLVIDRGGDEVDDGQQYSAGPSKRLRDSGVFGRSVSLFWRDSFGTGPSHSQGFETEIDTQRIDISLYRNDQRAFFHSTRDSRRASSVIAMDTICHSAGDDSMESVENYPGNFDDVPSTSKNPDVAGTSEIQAQQSVCFQPAAAGNVGEMGISSTNCEEEVLNAETTTAHAIDGPSVVISGGSVGMGASHEAEVHGTDTFMHRADSCVGDVEPVAEVVENQGQTLEFAPQRGSTDGFANQRMDQEDPQGDSQDVVSRSMVRDDSGSKIGSMKAYSVESGEKASNIPSLDHGIGNCSHPALSYVAALCNSHKALKEEVKQGRKPSPTDEGAYHESNFWLANGIGAPYGESNYEEGVEFDPLKHHNSFCPWVNENVAAAGCISSSTSAAGAIALCGWQLTLDALDTFQSLGHIPAQPVESESAASLYKDEHRTSGRKLIAQYSFSKRHGDS